MSKEPVNAMDLPFWEALYDALMWMEAHPAVRGALIASALQRPIFTAGNDVAKELYAPNTSAERYQRFWEVSNTFLARLYASPLLTVAAIRGACPAGGCAIAMCCDHRVMTEGGHIGLNEVAIGLPVPVFWTELFMRIVGHSKGEKLLLGGVLLKPAAAKQAGLLDGVVAEAELLRAAEEILVAGLKLPDAGRHATKRTIRADLAARWEAGAAAEARSGWTAIADPVTVKLVAEMLARLSRPKAKL